ncbi:MAG: non-hydrolyzing UDP-N-acetylglucosamine 2-epimerase [Bdellovibrionales bacterium]
MKRLKLLTVVGTRPEIIRLSRVVPLADQHFDHMFVHTGQNYDPRLKDVFFSELGLRAPDKWLNVEGLSAGQQVGHFLHEVDRIIQDFQPDRFLVLGDTNSALTTWSAKRRGVPVFHMEAGNRCFDDRVPEEINRRMIDQCSDVLLPYTQRSRENLIREGFRGDRIFVTGNPILEVFNHYNDAVESSKVLDALDLRPGAYFLVTLHRAENVDGDERLLRFIDGFAQLFATYKRPLVLSVHPRTRARLSQLRLDAEVLSKRGIICSDPFGFFDFAKLEKNAFCVLTDSGTVQEECCIFQIPNVTLRDVTERPETLDVGSNVLSGSDPELLLQSVELATQMDRGWKVPAEYEETRVAAAVVHILQSYW